MQHAGALRFYSSAHEVLEGTHESSNVLMNLQIRYNLDSRRKHEARKGACRQNVQQIRDGAQCHGAYERKKNLRRHRHSSQSKFA